MSVSLLVLVVLVAVFVVGMLVGQHVSHREVHQRERQLARARRANHELLRELRSHRPEEL